MTRNSSRSRDIRRSMTHVRRQSDTPVRASHHICRVRMRDTNQGLISLSLPGQVNVTDTYIHALIHPDKMASSTEVQDSMPQVASETDSKMSKEELASRLDHLKASAIQQYALKNYLSAAELFSEAAEVQDQINGEMSPENADLLYQYGRCLYHVGVSRSDVLGGKVAQQEEPKRKKRKVGQTEVIEKGEPSASGPVGDSLHDGEEKAAEEVVGAAVAENDGDCHGPSVTSKPFFQITGDENWTDSEEEEDDEAEAEEEEEDDFAVAYEILDAARVLLARKIGTAQSAERNDRNPQEVRQLRERLADTHDLQAEIKLENEQFNDAVNDARDALALKIQLYPQESGLIAEAHYKLSIALDFASLPTQPAEADDGAPVKEEGKVDEEMRQQAAEEMEKAILSCQARIKKEEAALSELGTGKLESAKRGITDAKDMVKDMKTRLFDLRNPAPVAALTAGGTPGLDGADPLRGVLGQLLGESKVEQAKRIAEATEKANDLSGLVKHRKKPKQDATTSEHPTTKGQGKRRAEDVPEESSGKKVKL